MNVRVLLVEDHTVVREGLRAILDTQLDIEVVAEAADGREAVEQARAHTPDVVIMDVALPRLNGIDATRQIVNELPKSKVVALSMHTDTQYVSEMLLAGARGYLLKDCASDELATAVRTVAAGKPHLSAAVADAVVEDYVNRLQGGQTAARKGVLSGREREVLQLLAEGMSTKEIASELTVSVKTIETHRAQIAKKLGIRSVAGLTKFAIRTGLTSLDP
jgi:two-component system, NarL family, response regulator NreC